MARLLYRRDAGDVVVLLIGTKDACEQERDRLLEAEGEMGVLFPDRYRIEEDKDEVK